MMKLRTRLSLVISVICLLAFMAAGQVASLGEAKKAMSLRNYDKAIEILQKVVGKNINNIEAHKMLVEAFVIEDRIDDFKETYKGLKLTNPGNKVLTRQLPEHFYGEGLSYKSKKNYLMAYGYFMVVDNLKRSYKDVDSEIFYCKRKAESQRQEMKAKREAEKYYKAGEDAYWKGDYMVAADAFRKVLAAKPDYKEKAGEWMFRGNKDYNLGKYDKAVGGFLLTVTLDINNFDVHKKLITSFIKLEKIDDLKAVYKNFKADFPDNDLLRSKLPDFFYTEGVSAKKKKDFYAALANFAVVKILKGSYKDVAALIAASEKEVQKIEKSKKGKYAYTQAEKNFNAGQYDKAVEQLKESLKYEKTYKGRAATWYKKGQTLSKGNKASQAKGAFRMAIALDFAQSGAHKDMVDLFIDAETLDEYKKIYGAYKKSNSRSSILSTTLPAHLYSKGVGFMGKKEYMLAKRCFDMTLYLSSNYKDAAAQMKKCDQGISAIRNQRQAKKDYMAGEAAFKANKVDRSFTYFAKALKLDPTLRDKADVWAKHGSKFAQLGKARKAIDNFKVSLLFNFNQAKVHQKIVDIFIEEDDFNGMKAMYNVYKKDYGSSSALTRTIPQYLFKLGAELKGEKEYAEAKQLFAMVKYFSATYKDVDRQIAACDREVSRQKEMIKMREQGQKDFETGFSQLKSGAYDKARASFKAAAKNYPGYEGFRTAVTWGMFKVGTEINKGQYKEAIAKLEVIALLDPENVSLHRKLISSYRKTNNDAGLKSTYTTLKKMFPRNKAISDTLAEEYYKVGADLKGKKQFKLAIKEFELVITLAGTRFKDVSRQIEECRNEIARLKKMEEYRKLAKDHYASGVKAEKAGDFANTILNFKKASQYDPKYEQLASDWIYRAEASSKQGKKDDAVKFYKIALALNRDNMKAHNGLITVLRKFKGNKFQTEYTQLKTAYPNSRAINDSLPAKLFSDGQKLAESGDHELALAKFNQASFFNARYKGLTAAIRSAKNEIEKQKRLSANRAAAKEAYSQGSALFKQGKVSDAADAFRKAASLDSRMKAQADEWMAKGKTKQSSGKKKDAASHYLAAIALNIDHKLAHIGLAKLYYEIKYITKLKTLYQQLAADFPGNGTLTKEAPQYFYDQGAKYKAAKDYEKAVDNFRIATMINPGFKDADKLIAECDKEIRRLANIAANKKKAKDTYNKGLDLYGKGKIMEAIGSFLSVAKLDNSYKKNASTWLQKGLSAFSTNKFTKAQNDLQVAVALDPDKAEAHAKIITLYLADGDLPGLKVFYNTLFGYYKGNKTITTTVCQKVYDEARIHQSDKDHELAIEKLDVVKFLNPGFKDATAQIEKSKREIARIKKQKLNLQKAMLAYEDAEELFGKKKYTEAMAKFAEVIGLDKRYKSYNEEWDEKGMKAYKLKNYREAINAFKVAVILDVDNKNAHQYLIESFIALDKIDEFETYYQGLKAQNARSKVFSTLPGHFFKTGEVSIKDEDYERALMFFQIVKTLNGKYKGVTQKISYCNKQVKLYANKKKAKKAYDLGIQAVMKGDISGAKENFEKARSLDPSYGNYTSRLRDEGMKDYNLGKYAIAVKKLGVIALEKVKDVEVHKAVITAGIKGGATDYLVELYEKIKIEFPFEPVVRRTLPEYFYGQAMKHKNARDYKTALAELEMVQILKPGYKDVDTQISTVKKKVR